MNEVFNSNNPAMRFLANLFNIVWVNFIFLFTCLPIITIGPALCALYKVCLKIVSGEDPVVYKVYFAEFKNSFKNGVIMWLGVLLLSFFFGAELYWIYFRHDLIPENLSFLQYPVWIMLFLVVQVFLYGFALQATFENSLKNTIKNSILLSIKNFMITILLIVVWLFTPLMMNTFQDFQLGFLIFEIMFNLALRVYICSVFLHRAFGLKRIKVSRNGSVSEITYDDEENPDGEESEDSDETEDNGSNDGSEEALSSETSDGNDTEKENSASADDPAEGATEN